VSLTLTLALTLTHLNGVLSGGRLALTHHLVRFGGTARVRARIRVRAKVRVGFRGRGGARVTAELV